MEKVIWILVLTMMGWQANAWSLKDLESIATEVIKSSAGRTAKSGGSADVDVLTSLEINGGLKTALTQGVDKAVSNLGVADGFFGNLEVKIPLPDSLKKVEKGLKFIGMGEQSDTLILTMNRVAEAAVPEAKILLVNAIQKMTLADARTILTGPEDAATQYFKKMTLMQMREKFLPIVKNAISKVQLAQTYNKYAELGSQFGVIDKNDVNIEQYVTNKALDGLYLMIAKEEAVIRKDPVGQTSSILKKVFGVIGK